MRLVTFRAATVAAILVLCGALTACGDSEADQRKAFIGFLQTYIIDKPGVHVPKPTDNDLKSFGPYAAHYTVITDFTGNPEMMGNREFAKATAARSALKQPDDLKPVYDKVFEKDVTAPVQGFNAAIPIAEDIAAASVKLADYIDSHRERVVITGPNVGGKDAQTTKELNALLTALNANGARFQEAQRRLRATLQGS